MRQARRPPTAVTCLPPWRGKRRAGRRKRWTESKRGRCEQVPDKKKSERGGEETEEGGDRAGSDNDTNTKQEK